MVQNSRSLLNRLHYLEIHANLKCYYYAPTIFELIAIVTLMVMFIYIRERILNEHSTMNICHAEY